MHFLCSQCEKIYPVDGLAYRCECGGLFNLYREPRETVAESLTLGEMKTPLVKKRIGKMDLHFKLDCLHPTGSFKDRGARTLISQLSAMGIGEIVEDSSGNAGASIAAYAAAAGIKCNIYLPERTLAGKIDQITAYGANVVKVDGTREDVSAAVQTVVKEKYYASHVYNPLFLEGTKSLAHEINEQVGVPDFIFVPTGNGTMLLGLYYGFKEIGKLPRLIAIQSENCRPLYREVYGVVDSEPDGPTAAEGIAVGRPMRLKEMAHAVKDSGGEVVTVSEEEILAAQEILGKNGIYTELTSGAALAGAMQYFASGKPDNYVVVVPLASTGLKK